MGQTTTPQKPASSTIRAEVNLVTVTVTVANQEGRFVTGLNSGNFRVFEDKVEQEILHCGIEDTPVSVVIVFDNSGSMQVKQDMSRKALVEMVKVSNPQDEYSLITFHDTAEVTSGWTDPVNIQNAILTIPKAQGQTALLDALYLAFGELRSAKHTRKVIMLITDGGDNHSRYNEHDIKKALEESDVQFYAIGIFKNPNYLDAPTQEERLGPTLLAELAEMNGGLAYAIHPDNTGQLDQRLYSDLAIHIGRAIRDEYILTYKPTEKVAHDGKRHKLKVKLDHLPRGAGFLNVYAREAYTASKR